MVPNSYIVVMNDIAIITEIRRTITFWWFLIISRNNSIITLRKYISLIKISALK